MEVPRRDSLLNFHPIVGACFWHKPQQHNKARCTPLSLSRVQSRISHTAPLLQINDFLISHESAQMCKSSRPPPSLAIFSDTHHINQHYPFLSLIKSEKEKLHPLRRHFSPIASIMYINTFLCHYVPTRTCSSSSRCRKAL